MPPAKSLFHKVWDAHTVRTLPDGQTQLFIGLHLIHEVTRPQAFGMLREMSLPRGLPRAHLRHGRPHHPDRSQQRPFADTLAEEMLVHLERSCREYGIRFFDDASGNRASCTWSGRSWASRSPA